MPLPKLSRCQVLPFCRQDAYGLLRVEDDLVPTRADALSIFKRERDGQTLSEIR